MMNFVNCFRIAVGMAVMAGGVLQAEESASKDDLVGAMLAAAQSPDADFEAALEAAKAGGVGTPELLSGRLVSLIVRQNIDGVIALEPELKAESGNFDFGAGKMFLSERQLFGLVTVFKALKAHREDRIEDFETHAQKAFVDAPQFVSGYRILDMMSELRQSEAGPPDMSDMRVPMDMEISNVEGETKTLKEWMGSNKAMLVDFWASWCGPCLRAMPSLKAKAESLPEQGVFVAALNTDDGDQLNISNKIRGQYKMDGVPWMMDPNGGKLSSILMIDTIPRMVLIDSDGGVLYNGHPNDPALAGALAKIDVKMAAH